MSGEHMAASQGRAEPQESTVLSQGHQAAACFGQEVWEALGSTFPPLEFFKGRKASL